VGLVINGQKNMEHLLARPDHGHISPEAIKLIKDLIKTESRQRLSATAALKSSWINKDFSQAECVTPMLRNTIEALKNRVKRKT
jgi:hypothetical protein